MINNNLIISLIVIIILILFLLINNKELFTCSFPYQLRNNSEDNRTLLETELLKKSGGVNVYTNGADLFKKAINEKTQEIHPQYLKYTGSNENKANCIDACSKHKDSNGILVCGPSPTDCNKRCENIEQCPFNSEDSKSRHALDCVKQCISTDGCSIDYCKNTCNSCSDNCYWNKFNEEHDDSPPSDHQGRPSPPLIFIDNFSADGTKIKIKWKYNKKIPNEITEYISLLYKTYKIEDGIKINKISNIYNCKNYCEYVITKLIPDISYTLYIRAKNSKGLGKASNYLTFIPKKKQINPIISIDNILNENDFNIASTYNYCST